MCFEADLEHVPNALETCIKYIQNKLPHISLQHPSSLCNFKFKFFILELMSHILYLLRPYLRLQSPYFKLFLLHLNTLLVLYYSLL